VAADHPTASAIGAEILRKGGSAADAGVATLLALGVLNPFASGLGGGGFCLYRRAADGESVALDFREVAPRSATRDMYVVGGKVDRDASRTGGKAVGVPGEAAGLGALHAAYGALPWADVVRPARALAQRGFYVGELLPKRLARSASALEAADGFEEAFAPGGEWVAHQDVLVREDLGRTLLALETKGPRALYEGPIAEAIVGAARASGGGMTLEDLSSYAVVTRAPLRGTYRGHELLTMPPPSSGGVAILQALNILSGFDLPGLGWGAPSVHLITEALKHAFADRARWLGDADFVKVPVARLVSMAYADTLRAKVDPAATKDADAYGSSKPPKDDSGTSHVSVVDAAGDMLACTSTVNTSFGAKVYVKEWGLTLNNEMDDFSAQPGVPNAYGLVGNAQNAIAPGKRPLSSMSPTLVLRDGAPFMAVGASGGPTIITGTLLAILRVIDFGFTPAGAITSARIHHQWRPHKLFVEPGDPRLDGLDGFGHEVDVRPAFNSVQMVVRVADGTWEGVSDPRKLGRPSHPGPSPDKEPER
jgi:gamma-glutamyltranspeptidase/glutathione hydrolase